MKAPNFWYRPLGLTAVVLSPFSLLWRLGTMIRRVTATPYHAKVPVICIGNIVAGGAGKTPTAIAFAQMLMEKGQKPVFVTRGYGGKLHGPLRVDPAHHAAKEVGDETLLLARVAPTWVGRDRAATIREAERHGTHVILDDGLQNPSVLPDQAFLVVDGASVFGNGCIIPAGPLRESLGEAMRRITAVIMVGEDTGRAVAVQARCPVLRAEWRADLPADFPRDEKFFAFAGIAHPDKFYRTCQDAGLTLVGTRDFADHHEFTAKEQSALKKQAQQLDARLLTTEKDFVRLPSDFQKEVIALPARLDFEDRNMVLNLVHKS